MKFVILFLSIVLASPILGQNAEEIIQKNLEATGGYNQWNSLNTIQIQGYITLGMEAKYPIEIYQKRPNQILNVILLKGKKFILEGYNGKSAIQNSFSTGKIEKINNYKPDNFDSDLLNYKSKGFVAEYAGTASVNGISCYKVTLRKNTNVTEYYFSTSNYYLLKEQTSEETLLYSDFRKVNNLVFPFEIEGLLPSGENEFDLKISNIVLNLRIKEELFNW